MKKPFIVPIWACAWCPEETWAQLKEGEVHTHGIYPRHKQEFLNKYQPQKQVLTLSS